MLELLLNVGESSIAVRSGVGEFVTDDLLAECWFLCKVVSDSVTVVSLKENEKKTMNEHR